jgi:hypothetical protein
VDDLEKVRRELERYEHPLVEFSAVENGGGIELVIRLRHMVPGIHIYRAPLHARDIASPQFAWTLQRYLYDCLHDYLVEMFVRTPQSREQRP